MSEQDDKAKRENIAEQVNFFLRSVRAPVGGVTADDITLIENGGVRVTKKLYDVTFNVEIGPNSLAHLGMAHGLIGKFGGGA